MCHPVPCLPTSASQYQYKLITLHRLLSDQHLNNDWPIFIQQEAKTVLKKERKESDAFSKSMEKHSPPSGVIQRIIH